MSADKTTVSSVARIKMRWKRFAKRFARALCRHAYDAQSAYGIANDNLLIGNRANSLGSIDAGCSKYTMPCIILDANVDVHE